MTVKLTKIWMDSYEENKTIRVDFDNDRHWICRIEYPHTPNDVAAALFRLAHHIDRDPYLRNK